jgi:hypothetical protein
VHHFSHPQHKIELAQWLLDYKYGVKPTLVMLEGDTMLVQYIVELQHPLQKKDGRRV